MRSSEDRPESSGKLKNLVGYIASRRRRAQAAAAAAAAAGYRSSFQLLRRHCSSTV